MLNEDAIVVGAYDSWAPMEQATILLKKEGLPNKDIELICDQTKKAESDEPEERSVAGAIAGVTLGVAMAWIVGILLVRFAGSMVLVVAAPILIILVSSIVGEFLGSVSDAFARTQMERSQAKGIESFVRGSKVLLSVHCHSLSRVKKIKDILKATGAQNISLNNQLVFSTR